MAAPGGALRPVALRPSFPAVSSTALIATVGAVAVILITVSAVSGLSGRTLTSSVTVVIGAAVLLYCFLEERVGRTLAIFLLYLTLLDGYLKLSTGSDLIVVGRDLVLLAIVAGMLARAGVRNSLSLPPLTGFVVLYVAICLVQLLNPNNIGFLHSLGGLRPHLEFVPLFFVAFVYLRTARRLRMLFLLLLAVTAINGVVALVQYRLTPEQLAGWGPGYRERIEGTGAVAGRTAFNERTGTANIRPFGLGSDLGFGGSLAVIAAPAGLALLMIRRRGTGRIPPAILTVGVALALITSQTRITVVLAVTALLAYVGLSSFSKRRLQLMGGILVTTAVAWLVILMVSSTTSTGVLDRYASIAPDRFVSTAVTYKSSAFAATKDYFTKVPVGAGLGSVGPASNFAGQSSRSLNGESEFNFLLIELGIPGLLAVLGLMVMLLGLAFRQIPRIRDDDVRPLLAAMGAALAAIFFGFAGAPVTSGVPLGPYLWLTAGTFSYWLIHRPREQRRKEMLAQTLHQ